MSDVIQVKRVVIVAETALQETLLGEVIRLGAHGYTCVYCFGKGAHETIADPFTGRSFVRIEIVARAAVAEAVLDYVHKARFENHAVIAYMDTVEVQRDDRFF
jgi:hypothetical protein